MTIREKILKGAQEAFFKAMLAGYAGDGNGSPETRTPDGYITTEFSCGSYRVVDRWLAPLSDCSGGTTTIYHEGVSVWWMSYVGKYTASAIPFLKQALRANYERANFHLGRGSQFFIDPKFPGMIYLCADESPNYPGLEVFSGWEEIVQQIPGSNQTISLGRHYILGKTLI